MLTYPELTLNHVTTLLSCWLEIESQRSLRVLLLQTEKDEPFK